MCIRDRDNATGATNYAAPGANRLKILPKLASRALNSATANTTTFFTIARVEEGRVTRKYTDTKYGQIMKEMSDRIYDTNGNYAVEPFNVRIREHLRTSTNLGKYQSSSSSTAGTISGVANKLVAEVEKGLGYVLSLIHI